MKRKESLHAAAPLLALAAELVPRLSEREVAYDRDGLYAGESVDELKRSGLLTLTVPVAEGGMGASLGDAIEVLRTLAHGSPSTALMLAMHTSILANYLMDVARVPGESRSEFLEQRGWAWGQAREGRIFAVANSEPGAGGDVHNSKAEVRREDGELRLYGTKTFASFGTNADYYMSAACDEHQRVDYYLVRNEAGKVTRAGEWNAVGMRSSESAVLRFSGASVVGPLCYAGMLDGANNRHWSTLSFTSIFVGTAESLLDEVCSKSTTMLQKVEAVELHLAVQAARAFLRHAVASEPSNPDGAYKDLVRDCKTFVTRSLAKQAASVFTAQTGGAYAFSSTISRKLRDLLAGPALRPPAAFAFDEIWESIGKSHER